MTLTKFENVPSTNETILTHNCVDKEKLNLIKKCVNLFCFSILNEYSKLCYHSSLEKKERAYQLISQHIPEDNVLQRNNWLLEH